VGLSSDATDARALSDYQPLRTPNRRTMLLMTRCCSELPLHGGMGKSSVNESKNISAPAEPACLQPYEFRDVYA
jgi:hypothetical protein